MPITDKLTEGYSGANNKWYVSLFGYGILFEHTDYREVAMFKAELICRLEAAREPEAKPTLVKET